MRYVLALALALVAALSGCDMVTPEPVTSTYMPTPGGGGVIVSRSGGRQCVTSYGSWGAQTTCK